MKRFKNTNLTHAEWEEVFSFPKNFDIGDIVECKSVIDPELIVWEVIELMSYKKGDDVVYKVKNLLDGTLACFSSTFLQPIGTFIDTEFFTKKVK
jgi:hypothetical protein